MRQRALEKAIQPSPANGYKMLTMLEVCDTVSAWLERRSPRRPRTHTEKNSTVGRAQQTPRAASPFPASFPPSFLFDFLPVV